MEIYLVGGAVRDKLLNIATDKTEKDWLVTGADPEDMITEGFTPVGKDFPVFLHPETREEYALARSERKSAPGYKGFLFHTDKNITVEEDLLRRDLTMNAIAEDQDGKLIDPYGGAHDIEKRIIRHVSPAFVEDPLRVLRLARFAAHFSQYGFRVAEETMALVRTIASSGELETLVAERIWQELHKALDSPNPEVFFQVLREGNALAIVFPEVDALFGVPQVAKYHPEVDSGVHLMMCLQAAVRLKADSETRFAVLCHDFGKATTPSDVLPRHIAHEKRSKDIARNFCQRLRVPKSYQQLAELVAEHHLLFQRAMELRPATVLKLLNHLSAFRQPDMLGRFLIACEADARGRLGKENDHYPHSGFLRAMYAAAANVHNTDVDAERFQGQAFGEELSRLRIKAIESAKHDYLENHAHE